MNIHDWKVRTLGSIATIERGKFSVRPRNDPRYFGGTMPFVQTGDVANAGMFLRNFSQTLNDDGVSVSKVFPAGTILMTIAANIGETAIATFPVACPDSLVAINPKLEQADTIWLKYALEAQQTNLDSQAGQNAQKNINLQVLEPLELLVPPLNEQHRIGKALLTWEEAILETEKLLVNSRKQKLALMQQLLYCKHRLPGFHGAWKVHRIGDVLREEKRPVQWDDDQEYPLISVRRRSGGAFHRETLKGHEILTKKLNTVAVGDFLISKMQVVHGAMAMVPPDLAHMFVSGSYITLRSTNDTQFDINFFGWLSATPQMYRHAYRSSYGVHIEKMTFDLGMFINERVSFPPTLGEQQAICTVLDAANRQIVDLQRAVDQLREEKRALMQQLLTGKHRVKLDAPVAEANAV